MYVSYDFMYEAIRKKVSGSTSQSNTRGFKKKFLELWPTEIVSTYVGTFPNGHFEDVEVMGEVTFYNDGLQEDEFRMKIYKLLGILVRPLPNPTPKTKTKIGKTARPTALSEQNYKGVKRAWFYLQAPASANDKSQLTKDMIVDYINSSMPRNETNEKDIWIDTSNPDKPVSYTLKNNIWVLTSGSNTVYTDTAAPVGTVISSLYAGDIWVPAGSTTGYKYDGTSWVSFNATVKVFVATTAPETEKIKATLGYKPLYGYEFQQYIQGGNRQDVDYVLDQVKADPISTLTYNVEENPLHLAIALMDTSDEVYETVLLRKSRQVINLDKTLRDENGLPMRYAVEHYFEVETRRRRNATTGMALVERIYRRMQTLDDPVTTCGSFTETLDSAYSSGPINESLYCRPDDNRTTYVGFEAVMRNSSVGYSINKALAKIFLEIAPAFDTSLYVRAAYGTTRVRKDGLEAVSAKKFPALISTMLTTGYEQEKASWLEGFIVGVAFIVAFVLSAVSAGGSLVAFGAYLAGASFGLSMLALVAANSGAVSFAAKLNNAAVSLGMAAQAIGVINFAQGIASWMASVAEKSIEQMLMDSVTDVWNDFVKSSLSSKLGLFIDVLSTGLKFIGEQEQRREQEKLSEIEKENAEIEKQLKHSTPGSIDRFYGTYGEPFASVYDNCTGEAPEIYYAYVKQGVITTACQVNI